MILIKSLNDYLVQPPFLKALQFNCNILKIDIVCIWNELVCAPYWKPFKFFCYGTLLNYLDNIHFLCKPEYWGIKSKEETTVYIQIDFRTTNNKTFNLLYLLLDSYKEFPVKFLLSGESKNKYKEFCLKFFKFYEDKLTNIELWETWKKYKKIEEYKLYNEIKVEI